MATYYVNPTGSNTSPFDTAAKGARCLGELLTGGGITLTDADIVNCVGDNGVIDESVGGFVSQDRFIKGTVRKDPASTNRPLILLPPAYTHPRFLRPVTGFDGLLIKDIDFNFARPTTDINMVYVGKGDNITIDSCSFRQSVENTDNCRVLHIQDQINNIIIKNNVFRGWSLHCIWVDGIGYGEHDVIVVNNSIYDCADLGEYPLTVKDYENVTVLNNIIHSGDKGRNVTNCTGTVIVDHNCVYDVTADPFGGLSQQGSEITDDPKFVDPVTGDFTLESDSPCKDTGTVTIATVDFNGLSRPQGSEFDMGAFEFDPSGIPAITDITPTSGVQGSSASITGTYFIHSILSHTFDGADGSEYTQTGPGSFVESGGKFSVSTDGINTATHTLSTPILNDFIIDFKGIYNTENGTNSRGTIKVQIEMSDSSVQGFELKDRSDLHNFLTRSIIYNGTIQSAYETNLTETTINTLRIERNDTSLIFSDKVNVNDSFSIIDIQTISAAISITKIIFIVDKGITGNATAARNRGIGGVEITDIAKLEFDSSVVIPEFRSATQYDFIIPSETAGIKSVDITNSNGSDSINYTVESNVAPTNLLLSSTYILEGSANGYLIGNITAVDANLPGDVHNFYLTYDEGGSFYILDNSLRLLDTESIRYVDAVSHYIIVKGIDTNGAEYQKGFYINVGDSAYLAAQITSFDGITTKTDDTTEKTITGLNFIDGGAPTVYIDDEVLLYINSYTNTSIKFNMPDDLDAGIHTLKVLNGNNL